MNALDSLEKQSTRYGSQIAAEAMRVCRSLRVAIRVLKNATTYEDDTTIDSVVIDAEYAIEAINNILEGTE